MNMGIAVIILGLFIVLLVVVIYNLGRIIKAKDNQINAIKAVIEKQGNITKLSEEEQNSFAKGVLTSCALSFIDYLDAHKYEGKMCVSNGECEDIENAFHNAMWDRLHRYYCKYIEKQGGQQPNPYSGTSFEDNGHTWGMCARDNGVDILCDKHLIGHLGNEQILANSAKTCKDAWSEEDEEQVSIITNIVQAHCGKLIDCRAILKWLKSLKERLSL